MRPLHTKRAIRRHFVAALLLNTAAAGVAHAQSIDGFVDNRPRAAESASRQMAPIRAASHAPESWPDEARFDLGPLNDEELARLEFDPDLRELEPIGVVREMLPGAAPMDVTAVSAWSLAPERLPVGRFCITSEGAVGMRVHFAKFEVPPGTTVTIVGDGDPQGVFTYSDKYPFQRTEFWSHTVFGQCVFVEVALPEEFDYLPIIEIDEVAHIIQDELAPDDAEAESAIPYSDPVTLPCHIPALCTNLTSDMRDSVVRLRFVEFGSVYQCSGVVLNDIDENTVIGWLVTAHHCISTPVSAESVEATWFFHSQQCTGPAGVQNSRTILGSKLLGLSPTTDFSFMRLDESPPPGYALAGWNAGKVGGPLTIVHHPRGTEKRIAYGHVVRPKTRCISLAIGNYLYVDLDDGITEPGSSGSPAFDGRGRVVGQLYGTCGGDLTCADAGKGFDVFGAFARSYKNAGLDQYLNVVRPDDSFEPNDAQFEAAPITLGTYQLQLLDDDDYFLIDVPRLMTLKVQASFTATEVDVDLQLIRTNGQVLKTSLGSGNLESFSVEVPAGLVVLRAHRSGGGGRYTLRVAPADSPITDIDGDEDVDTDDVLFVLREFNTRCTSDHLPCGDVTGEGLVNSNDLRAVLAQLGIRRIDYDDKSWKKFIGKHFKQNYLKSLKTLSKPERRQIMNELVNLR